MQGDRWSRNCGSGGVGHSGTVNEYRSGVLIGNFVENAAKTTGRMGETILSHTGPGAQTGIPTTTQKRSYTAEGKTGEYLVEASTRHDLNQPGVKGELLTRHGRFDEPPVQCLGTTYQLTYGRADGTDRRVQSYLWHGRKQVDYFVPHSTGGPSTLSLTARKQQEWGTQGATDAYLTTKMAATQPAALATAENPTRTQTLRPLGDSGLMPQPGQKPKGFARDELDKPHHRTGLRVNYRS
ncbi:hypothetical protein CHLRE_11g469000v5 [Chlamydomonas reinhardtii]|uniref:Uncharacterized protein n=1 Tax=Chlamydomonas reinhardtii TaxID=3055 RepID=A8JC52_CHLRE|nr:uncharacterized protein CHLRE_11g469000v5 [Chlamydomonas reinhardtii]6U42_7O Chain 7O, FAP107 [Chlamydomonas reinhardtii]6U42_7P Chain 7P, FAP107 [Chlamydomonas reinhardtii]8GLV_7P Chain 7P, Flagellar associated protein [Chlamydomonas reinhardtii]8GLV_Hv Chain Hv, Flagellar associated protein [Chlamydomonas reinhardtii]8GLV_PV Chain PV, Flagellar associated protein [Chlamydomonas reinhardtii]PNW76729.1 hypothetical protein CHLRE_11g469000v5 [Chlamydomonas reinhardtii]|eukprot:XP_001699505.1 flagellar associated protein [Chlamydomonas reinhardtii]